MPVGQGVNADSIRRGLLAESEYKPQTGTFGGDRAASDFARSMQYSNAAQVGRDLAKGNAQSFNQRQQQGQQMAQQWAQAQMGRFKSLMQQKSQQSALAARLLEQQIGMQSDWQTGLIGMMR